MCDGLVTHGECATSRMLRGHLVAPGHPACRALRVSDKALISSGGAARAERYFINHSLRFALAGAVASLGAMTHANLRFARTGPVST